MESNEEGEEENKEESNEERSYWLSGVNWSDLRSDFISRQYNVRDITCHTHPCNTHALS